MDLIRSPIDNLYRFMALGGLILLIVGLVYPPWLFHQSSMEYLASLKEDDELKVHQKFDQERLEILDSRKREAEANRDKLQKRINDLILLKSKSTNATHSAEIDKLETRLQEAKSKAEALADAWHELNLSLELKAAQTKHQEIVSANESRNSRTIIVVGWVMALIGLFLSFVGFYFWYKRVVVFQDAILVMQATSQTAASKAKEAQGSE